VLRSHTPAILIIAVCLYSLSWNGIDGVAMGKRRRRRRRPSWRRPRQPQHRQRLDAGAAMGVSRTARDYRRLRSTDLALYRSPAPGVRHAETPLVAAVVNYYNVTLPLTPYSEGYVVLACRYQGRDGWHVLTMPVDDAVANAGGALGFLERCRRDRSRRIRRRLGRPPWLKGRDIGVITFTPEVSKAQPNRRQPTPDCRSSSWYRRPKAAGQRGQHHSFRRAAQSALPVPPSSRRTRRSMAGLLPPAASLPGDAG
jgi:hypothetical protein